MTVAPLCSSKFQKNNKATGDSDSSAHTEDELRKNCCDKGPDTLINMNNFYKEHWHQNERLNRKGRKYLQLIYPITNWYPEYIKNSRRSITTTKTQQPDFRLGKGLE